MSNFDFGSMAYVNAVKSEIRKCLIDLKANSCPMACRLAWHASGTYSKVDGTGGCNGATMRFEPESADGANAGLGIERDILLPVKEAFPELSHADIWALAGACAIEYTGGPDIDHVFGRTDAPNGHCCPAVGRLPDASQGAEHLRDVFGRMGFNDQEIVALSGAHTLGRCHQTRSGFDGPWTAEPLKFDNTYFSNLLNLEWSPRKWDGPMQYEDKSKTLMMLPTDIALIKDPKMRPHVERYAKDEAVFRKEFKAVYEKLITLNFKAPASKAQSGVDPSRELREHCMHGSLERAQAFIAKGADVNAAEPNSGRTALHKAAFWGHDHIIPWLISVGVDVNATDFAGDTALHDAARFGHVTCVEQLLGGGANAQAKNKKGQTAIDVANQNGKVLPALGATGSGGDSRKRACTRDDLSDLREKLHALATLRHAGLISESACAARQAALCEKHGL